MAHDLLTVADLVADALDLSEAEVSNLLNAAPLVGRMPVEESSNGTTHKYSIETGAPVVGFRAENVGRDHDHSVDTVVSIALKILDFSWHIDKAVADESRKRSLDEKMAREGNRHLRAAMFKAEAQFLYGTGAGGDAGGYAGLADNAGLNGLNDAMVVNAGGTTANTGSSCWLLTLGPNDAQAVYNGDQPFSLGERHEQMMADADGKLFPAYCQSATTWLGMQVGSAFSVARIANLTADTGKGLTDDLIYDAISRFPSGRQPNLIVCSRRSLKQLRESRTATNATGAPAPRPADVDGIQILNTDAILNTEALVA